MVISKLLKQVMLVLVFMSTSLIAHDILLEFKGAYFLSTGSHFKKIYNHGGALCGPEVTFSLSDEEDWCEDWYGFASIDFLTKKGHSIGLCTPTKVYMVPLAFGAKYLVPFRCGDFYVGLGLQAVYLKTKNFSPFVIPCTSEWGVGGIAKIGSYFDLPHDLFIDLFIDYSFVKVGQKNNYSNIIDFVPNPAPINGASPLVVEPIRANLSGAVFGIGFGYRFN